MSRQWTPEQKQAASERAKARISGGAVPTPDPALQQMAGLAPTAISQTVEMTQQGTSGFVSTIPPRPISLDDLTESQKAAIAEKYVADHGLVIAAPKPTQVVYIQKSEDHYGADIEPGWHYTNVERHAEYLQIATDPVEERIREGYTECPRPSGWPGEGHWPSQRMFVMRIPMDRWNTIEKEIWRKDAARRDQDLPNAREDEERFELLKDTSKKLLIGSRA